MKNNSTYDAKLIVKRWAIFLLIAFPVMLVVATILTVVNVPTWAVYICTILSGGATLLLEYVIYLRRKEKREKEMTSNFDPFKD